MPRQLFQCRVCNAIYNSVDEALKCEALPTPSFAFKVGQKFRMKKGNIITIEDRMIILKDGKHVIRYKITRTIGPNRPGLVAEHTLKEDRYTPIN